MKNIAQCLYDAFTLVEMLIVMGIIIVLAAVGITAGRYAINRANDISHETAANNVYTALQAYYTDHREFPSKIAPISGSNTIAKMILEGGVLNEYIGGSFDPGTDAMYYYVVSDDQQLVFVCVSLWGCGDNNVPDNAKLYCAGNGFGSDEIGSKIKSNYVGFRSEGYYSLQETSITCNWYDSEWQY